MIKINVSIVPVWLPPVKHPPKIKLFSYQNIFQFNWVSMSADSLDAPNSECIVLSIENFSSKPFIYFDLEMGVKKI